MIGAGWGAVGDHCGCSVEVVDRGCELKGPLVAGAVVAGAVEVWVVLCRRGVVVVVLRASTRCVAACRCCPGSPEVAGFEPPHPATPRVVMPRAIPESNPVRASARTDVNLRAGIPAMIAGNAVRPHGGPWTRRSLVGRRRHSCYRRQPGTFRATRAVPCGGGAGRFRQHRLRRNICKSSRTFGADLRVGTRLGPARRSRRRTGACRTGACRWRDGEGSSGEPFGGVLLSELGSRRCRSVRRYRRARDGGSADA